MPWTPIRPPISVVMKRLNRKALAAGTLTFAMVASLLADSVPDPQCPPVTAAPASFFQLVRERDREAARQFYKKHLDIKGMPVAASAEVADQALQRAYEIVTHILAGRPDVFQAMVSNGMYLIIIGKDQVYTDMPEYRNHPNPAYQNERVAGHGRQADQLRRGEPALPAGRPLRRREHRRPRILPHH